MATNYDHSMKALFCYSLFIFPGNPFPLTAIQWRTTEDYLVFGYNDDSAFVWQMQTAHLDRVLHGKNARDVLEDDRWPLNHISVSTIQRFGGNTSKQTVSIRSIMSSDNGRAEKRGISIFVGQKRLNSPFSSSYIKQLCSSLHIQYPTLGSRLVYQSIAPINFSFSAG